MLTPRPVAPAVLALALLLPAARAADVDPYAPADSEWVLHINVKQLAAAPAVKKHAAEPLRTAVSNFEALKALAPLGIDPLKDAGSVTAAGSGLLQYDRALLIVRGRFDAGKLRRAADELAKQKPTVWQVLKEDGVTFYEVREKGQPAPTYLAFADGAVLISAGKKYVAAAAAVDPARPAKVSEALQALVAKADAGDDVWLAAPTPKRVREVLAKSSATAAIADDVTAFTARIKVGEDVAVAFNVQTDKKESAEEAAQLLDAGKGFAALAVRNVEGLGPLLAELLDAGKTSTDGTTATLTGRLSAEQIAKALKK
jgi:hypothetical protein